MDSMLMLGALFAAIVLALLAFAVFRYSRGGNSRGGGNGDVWSDGGSGGDNDACDSGGDAGGCDGGGGGD